MSLTTIVIVIIVAILLKKFLKLTFKSLKWLILIGLAYFLVTTLMGW